MSRAALATAVIVVVTVAAGCPTSEGSPDAGTAAGEGEGDAGEGEGEGDAGTVFDGELRQERSLVWTDAALLDDPTAVGMVRALAPAAQRLGTTPGALLSSWLVRFATTAHSERAGPAQLAFELADTFGDPSTWDVDQAPFRVTAVHNRIDLLSIADGHCGELRVSLASTHEILRPFHVLFLYRQPAGAGDVDGDGNLTCLATANRWAQLSALDGAEWLAAARALLDEGLVADRFLLTESVELTVSPWEWRQWTPSGAELDNPPLFQQLDLALNQTGARRDDFLAFVEANAAALDARTLLFPDRFRAPSVRVTQGIPWQPLDVDVPALATFPQLRQHLEIQGCAACHTADAEFVQTKEDRTFSHFYTEELKARAVFLDDILHGTTVDPGFGPLQQDPVLPP